MKIPYSLLQKFLPLENRSLKEIEDTLVSLGIEVDEILGKEPTFSGVVAGDVIEKKPHPNSKKLRLLKVNAGHDCFTVVCGDLSVQEKEVVAFAPVGATLQGKKIGKKDIKGETSFGALSSAAELGIYQEADKVLRLDATFSPGKDLSTELHDPLFTVSLTPNLGHVQSVLGVARELGAAFSTPLKNWQPQDNYTIQSVPVEDATGCSRYSFLTLKDIPKISSPFWLRYALQKAGFSSSFLLVDLLQYVMLCTGQPMHAFSLDAVSEDNLSVRKLQKKTPLLFLDGVTRTCPMGSLGIFAGDELAALAGIMGGSLSSVTKDTTSYFLEAAHFCPKLIRKTSQAMHLRTESSVRFEKGIDPSLGTTALSLVQKLLESITPLQEKPVVKTSCPPPKRKVLFCRKRRVDALLGSDININEMQDIFTRLDCKIALESPDTLRVAIPTYRNDLTEEIDLIEEIARIYGYQHLEKEDNNTNGEDDPFYVFCEALRNRALKLSFNECITADLVSPKLVEITEELSLTRQDLLETLHAKSEDYSILRSSLLGSLLQVLERYIRSRYLQMQGFEIGKIHYQGDKGPVEETVLSLLTSGETSPTFWGSSPKQHDYYLLKGAVETLLDEEATFIPSKHPSLHPMRQADIYLNGEDIGVIGEVHPEVLERFSITQKVFFAEIHIEPLYTKKREEQKVCPLSPYPSSIRDWTIVLPEGFFYASLEKILQKVSSPILESASLIDLFLQEETKKKHFTLRFTYRSMKGTLSLEEVEKEHAAIQKKLEKQLPSS